MAVLVLLLALLPMVMGSPDSFEDIGHSRDYHLICDDTTWERMLSSWNQDRHQQLYRLKRDSTVPSLDEIEKFVKTFEPAFVSANKTLQKLINHTAVLTYRLKLVDSIQEKLVRKNLTLNDLNDVIGLRLTCQTVDDTLRIKDLILAAKDDFNVTEIECHGMCPGYPKFEKSGYRRIHLILFIKEVGKPVELQIGTPYTNMWSDWNHGFIYKGSEDTKNDDAVIDYNLKMAEYFWKLDEDRRILPPCPQILQKANALKILRDGVAGDHAEETYQKLGYPPNACFWWNDMKLAEGDCSDKTTSGSNNVCPETTNICSKTTSGSNNIKVGSLLAIMLFCIFLYKLQ